MRIVFLGNGELALEVIGLLQELGDEVVALVVHPEEAASQRSELVAQAAVPDSRVFVATQMEETDFLTSMTDAFPDVILSVKFGYRVRSSLLELFPGRIMNLHMSLLPFNRGVFPTAWSIIDRTPAGVTLHLMDEGFDTGAILAQRSVEVRPWDTGESMYRRCNRAAIELMQECWPAVQRGELEAVPQPVDAGTSHVTSDAIEVDEIDLGEGIEAGRLIDIIRARTFPPYDGAFFRLPDGRRVSLRLELIPEDLGRAGARKQGDGSEGGRAVMGNDGSTGGGSAEGGVLHGADPSFSEVASQIRGVRLGDLRSTTDESTTQVELLRRSWFFPRPAFVQAGILTVTAGGRLGIRLHRKKATYWCLLEGRAQVGFHDMREGSVSFGLEQAITLDATGRPVGLLVPQGVAIGIVALESVRVLRFVDAEDSGVDEATFAWDDPIFGFESLMIDDDTGPD